MCVAYMHCVAYVQVFVCLYLSTCMCVDARACLWVHIGAQSWSSSIPLYFTCGGGFLHFSWSLPISAILTSQLAWGSFVSASQILGSRQAGMPSIYLGSGDLNSSLILAQQMLYSDLCSQTPLYYLFRLQMGKLSPRFKDCVLSTMVQVEWWVCVYF